MTKNLWQDSWILSRRMLIIVTWAARQKNNHWDIALKLENQIFLQTRCNYVTDSMYVWLWLKEFATSKGGWYCWLADAGAGAAPSFRGMEPSNIVRWAMVRHVGGRSGGRNGGSWKSGPQSYWIVAKETEKNGAWCWIWVVHSSRSRQLF